MMTSEQPIQPFYRAGLPYAVALGSVVLAIALRLLLDPLIGNEFPFATVFLAILLTAWLGGFKPAMVAVVCGGIGSALFLLRERFTLHVNTSHEIGLALYALVGTGLAILGGAMHSARTLAERQMQESLQRQAELTRVVQEREQAQLLLRESQQRWIEDSERLRVTLASIGDAVIATDAAGRVTFMNAVAESLTGWSSAEAEQRDLEEVFQIVNEATRQPVENPVKKVLREGKIVGLANHTVLINRQGSSRPIDDSAAPIRDVQGQLMGVVLVFRDVSERRHIEETRARLAAIVNSSDDAIVSKSFDGIITSWNSGAEQLYGYKAQEIIGRPFSVLIPPDIPSEIPEVLEKIHSGSPLDQYETIRITKDGRRIRVAARISAIRNDEGKVIGASVIARDITHRDQAERLRNMRLGITQILAHATSVDEALPEILKTFCEHMQWSVGNYWEVDEDAVRIGCRLTWHLPQARVEEFQAASQALKLRLREGVPGRVWESGQPCWVVDITQDGNFPRADVARRTGLRTAFAMPLLIGQHVFGVLEFFTSDMRPPDDDLLELVGTLGWQLGQFIERQRAEEALRQSEADLSDFFEKATVGLHWVGPDGNILRVNQEELEMLGYSREEYIGHHIAEFHVDQAAIADILRRLAAGERLQDYPAQMRAKDGSILDVLIDSSVMWDNGRFVHSRSFTRDVTVRKRNEELLQFLADASAALAGLVDYHSTLQKVAHLAVPHFADWCTIDMLDEHGALQRVAVVHADPGRVKGAQELTQQHPADRNATTGIWHILQSGATELIPEISDDLPVDAVSDAGFRALLAGLKVKSYLAVPLHGRGKPIGVLTFFAAESGRRYSMADVKVAQDLAGRATIAIENARLYAELREQSRQKDEFLAMLAHELRNPLAPLRNGLEIMDLVGGDPAALQEAREIMQRQLDQMVRLVDDLLDISRITRGKLELRKERVDLAKVIHIAVETSRPIVEAAQHDLVLSLPDEAVQLKADVTRLAQIFANLLNNSAKYTPPGGRIELAARLDNGEVAVSVRDNGIGISPGMLPHIFEMFTQVDRSLDRSQGGLGIGLTLVRRLVEMHGGQVEAHSAGEGRGSEFVVRLPVVATSDERSEPTDAPTTATGLAARRILVVDDNRDSALTLSMMLRLMGNETHTAFDGAAALQAADQFRPDLIVLDIGLPKMSGYEVARQVREQPWGRDMVLVALTGWGQEEDRRRSQQAGFNYHFVKPINIDDLKRVLTENQAQPTA
jgi:PAS domain S-box-containing protein